MIKRSRRRWHYRIENTWRMYTPLFVLLAMFNIILCGSETRNPYGQYQNGNVPPYTDVINVGNGVNRKNVVVLDEREDSNGANYPDTPGASENGNRNTAETTGSRRTVYGENSDGGRQNTGTNFAKQNRNGVDYYHIGNGPNNKNTVIVNGIPIQPEYTDTGRIYQTNRGNADCHDFGGPCDDVKIYSKKSNSDRKIPTISLLLTFLSLLGILHFKTL